MLTGLSYTYSLLTLSLTIYTSALQVQAAAALPPSTQHLDSAIHYAKRGPNNNPLGIDWGPAPSPEDGPPGAANALRDPAYLPAQIAGIVGSYAFSLVLVALTLLVLSKKRRGHLLAAEEIEQVWDPSNSEVFDYDFAQKPTSPSAPSGPPGTFYLENPPSYRDGVYDTRPVSDIQPASLGHIHGHVRNFSLPSPTATNFEVPRFVEASRFQEPQRAQSPSSNVLPSPTSTTRGPLGQDPEVPQEVVKRDREMAQTQLEQMYKYVMEQEEAKEAGVQFHAPMIPAQPRDSTLSSSTFRKEKKEKNKPASLNLSKGDKKESRTSSILSALKSPLRKKQQPQGVSISSPIMTPMSGTFPQQYAGEEMSAIAPRHYAPALPPAVPMNHSQASFASRRNTGHIAPLMTPPHLADESSMSIDGRMGAIAIVIDKDGEQQHRYNGNHSQGDGDEDEDEDGEGYDTVSNLQQSRHISLATTTADGSADPVSAISETSSQAGLLGPRTTVITAPPGSGPRTSGLPTSPKPGVNRFPSLPSSPAPGATTFASAARGYAPPSAVRTGGMLPLRAYESAMLSPTTQQQVARGTVKETVFQRTGPMSPGGMHTARTPMTSGPVPYSPYQPFSPVVPITPSLVTREDRKKMRRMEPKTPTLQMVKSDDELW